MTTASSTARTLITVSGGALVAAAPFVTTGVADAGGFVVTNLDDSGVGSLRQAIADANASGGTDTITFQAGLTGTITVLSEMKIFSDVTIQGPGADVITVSGNHASDILYVYVTDGPGTVTISGLTIANGEGSGGAIYNYGDHLVLDSVVLTGNHGDFGPALYSKNHGDSESTVTIRNSTITGNTAEKRGGAVYITDTKDADYPVITIENSTFSNNTSVTQSGGAVYVGYPSGPVLISNSTFSGNTADNGGALYIGDAGPDFVIANTTITGNHASTGSGGGIYLYYGTINLENTIVGGNDAASGGDDIDAGEGDFVGHYSLVTDITDGAALGGANNVTGVLPLLGTLADNGGTTQTHLPLAGSPAINAGDPSFSAPPVLDQRGIARVLNGRLDIGSVEVGGVIPDTGSASGLVAGIGAALLGLGGVLRLTSRRRASTHS